MKRYFFPLVLLTLLLSSCRTLQVRDFHSREPMPARLPKLGLLVHERSFLEAFDVAFTREVVINNMVGGPYIPAPWVAYSMTDQALRDVFSVLGNELEENMNQGTVGLAYGHAKFKLMHYQRRNSGWGWTIASAGMLMIPNLFGMPFRTNRVELELQLEIEDARGQIIARYSAPGVGKAVVAAYHGYENTSATRKANLLALQDAMSAIKQQLTPNVPTLINQLEATGQLERPDGK
ncbi:MAG: hypothetical protein IT261_00765 [Saprospiraceae bacterium]|nr:hypothetical protein [Saprospiraceae bacterium]